MKILITDDEPLARTRLAGLVRELGHEVVGEATNGNEAILFSEQLHPDLVLMDIRMPRMDGLEAARHLAGLEQPPAVVFVTAYDEHALQAFEANAIDYLLKPIRKERLESALSKSIRLNQAQITLLRQEDGNTAARTHICARTRGKVELIPIENVYYFLADQKYVSVAYPQGEVLIEEALKSLEDEFGERFVRIHRNALVAREQIQGLEKKADGSHVLLLRDSGQQLEISRRHVASIRKIIKDLG